MKKKITYLFSTLAMVLIFGGPAFAQPIKASAEIVSELSWGDESLVHLNFGQLLNTSSEDVTLDPNDNNNNAGLGGQYQHGVIDISGSGGATVLINITDPANLQHTEGTATIGFTGAHTGGIDSDVNSSSDITTGSGTDFNRDLSETGEYYLFFGGTLAGEDIDGAEAGTYEAIIEVDVSYL